MSGRKVSVEHYNLYDLPDGLCRMLSAAPDHLLEKDGFLYFLCGQTVIKCADSPEGRELLFAVRTERQNDSSPSNAADLCLRLLFDPFFQPSPDLCRRIRLKTDSCRCVLVFRALSPSPVPFSELFLSVIPFESDDIPVCIDRQTAALIKNLDERTDEEISDYASAVLETLESEGINGIRIGIGRPVARLSGIRSSYLDAWKALQTGFQFHPDNPVYQYTHLTLERILDSIPEEKQREIMLDFYQSTAGFQMSEELMDTVNAFFDNDLNLTATARQLYIHRNTLNYRLDKIKKELGLDLRNFRDAAIFKMISFISGTSGQHVH